MSSIVLFAPCLALLTAFAAYALAVVLGRRVGIHRNSILIRPIIPVVVFLISIPFYFDWLHSSTTQFGTNVSATEANRYLLTFEIPAAATNVDYRHSFFEGHIDVADFDLSESDFLTWMSANSWQPQPFMTEAGQLRWPDGQGRQDLSWITVIPVANSIAEHRDEIQIMNGYYFDDYSKTEPDDSGLTIVFDSDRQRVYIGRTTY